MRSKKVGKRSNRLQLSEIDLAMYINSCGFKNQLEAQHDIFKVVQCHLKKFNWSTILHWSVILNS